MAGVSRRMFLAGAGVAIGGLAGCRWGSDDRGDRQPEERNGRPTASYDYGDHRRQVADLYRPAKGDKPWPVVVLLHGGFWQENDDRSQMVPLATDLAGRGFAVWNVGCRSSSDDGGGWPGTFEDVGEAIDRLGGVAGDHDLDLERVVTVGHSAGGTLSLWAAARPTFDVTAPGHDPTVTVRAAVALAAVSNLVSGWFEGLGSEAVDALMGSGPNENRGIYRLANPEDLLPIGVRQLLVHGTDDPIVPLAQSTAYQGKAAELGDDVELVVVDGMGHFDVIDPTGKGWEKVVARLPDLFG